MTAVTGLIDGDPSVPGDERETVVEMAVILRGSARNLQHAQETSGAFMKAVQEFALSRDNLEIVSADTRFGEPEKDGRD